MVVENKKTLKWIALVAIAAPTGALAGIQAQGIQAQGIQAQGIQAQGIQAQGIQAQGIQAQGIQAQGIQAQGIQAQGIQAQGIQAQGIQAQGIQAQGIQAQGVSVIGNDVSTGEYAGVAMSSVEIRGTFASSPIVTHELTSIPGVSTGTGNYIAVGGASVVGRYAVAHLVDRNGLPAEDLDLYIAAEQRDPVGNLFHRADQQDNQDELYVVYFFHRWSGQWMSLCPYNVATGSASAMPIPEDPTQPHRFIFACTATGVAAKCARNWGYRPWATTTSWSFKESIDAWVEETHSLKPYYDVCKAAAQASYCQDGRSYTKDGTLVDLFDTRQIIWPNAIENPWNEKNPDSLWMMSQEYFISFDPSPSMSSIQDSALQRTRYRELSPVGQCDNFAYIDRLEHDHLEDGRWASPLTNTPRIQMFSPTYCTHDASEEGEALPWDCSPCTTAVCRTMPECCSVDPTLPQPVWNAACTAQAATVCADFGVPWPKGKVWPRDLPKSNAPPAKYLLGPSGAVVRVEGTSATASSATISGWVCDPEWPGGAVAVQIWDAPREQSESLLLGTVHADLALSMPLAREVGAACDGPGRSSARHGFRFTLPENQQGNVFVYAIDRPTEDGPAAPPTLIRNGIVHVPSCAHSEHVAGALLDATCSACVTSICEDGSHGACCSTAWTDDCVAAAANCAPASKSAPANSNVLAAVTTGWIEAPADGNYVFDASVQPSRVFVNGKKVLDWFEAAGTTQGSIELSGGIRYHLRWDRLQTEAPTSPGPGLTWQAPGASGQAAIPSTSLYAVAPGTGTGLRATYYSDPGFVGGSVTRTDAVVDLGTKIVPPSPIRPPAGYAPSFSAIWEGELVPSFTETYEFFVVGSGTATLTVDGQAMLTAPAAGPPPEAGGCSHNLCVLGDKIAASTVATPACNPCVDAVCLKDPYCCNGGYLSYYSTEPQWDAKCIAEVKTECGIECKNPLPSPVSPEKKSIGIPLVAGVHYKIRLAVDNGSVDDTIRLLWSSPRTGKGVIPQFSLYPAGLTPEAAGAGLNVAYFGTTTQNSTIKANLNTVLAAGASPDLSLTPTVGQSGTPLVDLLAPVDDTAAATPAPPSVVRPRYLEEVFDATAQVKVDGIGGVAGYWISIAVGGVPGETVVQVQSDGSFSAIVPVPSHQGWKLLLKQRSYQTGPCVAPALCTESTQLIWPVIVSVPSAPSAAPVISIPSDPVHSPNPAANLFQVLGKGIAEPVTAVEEGTGSILSQSFNVSPNGQITGTIELSNGASDPNQGWHKLRFTQGGTPSAPVFISVGIQPPTVEFPRTGAAIDCDQPDPPGRNRFAFGTLPYPIERFGRLRVMEETGRQALAFVGAETRYVDPQQPGDPIRFVTDFSPGYGKHLIYFFQAPDPPANATQVEIDAHFRAFATLADTPTSRIEINVPPPRFQTGRGSVLLLQGNKTGQTLHLDVGNCGPATPAPAEGCALPFADVNVRIGPRLFTTRATATGNWTIDAPLDVGWNDVRLAQVVDSPAGGAWRESCLSETVAVGVATSETIVLTLPGPITVDATSPQGAVVRYVASGTSTLGNTVVVDCVPTSGSTFPVGQTLVRCTGRDVDTGNVGLGGFLVTVLDGPPTIHYPKDGIVAEATSALGALVSFDVTATDPVSGPVPVECFPASPAQFPLDEVSFVRCQATDPSGQQAEAKFTVRVHDTTPPDLCPLSDIEVGSTSGAGAFVTFSTCAKDLVDGSVGVNCDHPSGSFFPIGKTLVTCTATDRHDNRSPPSQFVISVGDATPPVLKLPGTVTAFATSRRGARVSYVVGASDNIDPDPVVACAPPSGSLFPIGTTVVKCTAADASGNTTQGSFSVRVLVSWSGFILPPDALRFPQRLPLPTVFRLTGPSSSISDLPARLFVAPVDAAGNVGAERPAAKLPAMNGNLFDFIPFLNVYLLTVDTRPMAPGIWQLRADLGDGENHAARVTLLR
jgi:hypothetical protein